MTNGTICEDGTFDIEAVIKEFIADSARGSLELPHMTTGQRKQVKKAADQHPDLKCESYGFGAERKLHLFKTCWENLHKDKLPEKNEAMNAVNVKNTFIDGWVGDEDQSEPIVFRSMPDGMYRNLLQQECRESIAAGLELSPIRESSSMQSSLEASPSIAGSPATVVSNLDLPPELEAFQVRNTFIQFEAEAVDARIVQSMPHGMFSQLIGEQSAREATVTESNEEAHKSQGSTKSDPKRPGQAAAPEAAVPAIPSWHAPVSLSNTAGECQLMAGTLVVVEGLVKLPAFNGLSGVIQSLDVETGRYSVLLTSPTLTNGQQLAKVKAQNLRLLNLLPPPPPLHAAPSVLVDAPSAGLIDIPPTPEGATPLQLTALVPCF